VPRSVTACKRHLSLVAVMTVTDQETSAPVTPDGMFYRHDRDLTNEGM